MSFLEAQSELKRKELQSSRSPTRKLKCYKCRRPRVWFRGRADWRNLWREDLDSFMKLDGEEEDLRD